MSWNKNLRCSDKKYFVMALLKQYVFIRERGTWQEARCKKTGRKGKEIKGRGRDKKQKNRNVL